jgi:hypothetical protein
MNRQVASTNRFPLWSCIALLALSFSLPAAAATDTMIGTAVPKPGNYCPDLNIRLVVAEELSTSLELAMRSRAALINHDQATAISELLSTRTTLHLAASRGAAARTILLIDAIIQAKVGENYTQLLTWFPLLQTSLLTLPDDATVNSANDSISRAEEVMQGDKSGDAITPLKEARHMLACDSLDIPLQQAMQAQDALMKSFGQSTNPSAYVALRDALRSALVYTLGNSEK